MSAKPYVKCMIESEEGILFIRRRQSDTCGGFWETPGGGIEGDETPEQAIVREVKEETSLDITVDESLKIPFKDDHSRKDFDGFCFHTSIDGSTAMVDITKNHDHEDFIWLNSDNVNSFIQDGNEIDRWSLTHLFLLIMQEA